MPVFLSRTPLCVLRVFVLVRNVARPRYPRGQRNVTREQTGAMANPCPGDHLAEWVVIGVSGCGAGLRAHRGIEERDAGGA